MTELDSESPQTDETSRSGAYACKERRAMLNDLLMVLARAVVEESGRRTKDSIDPTCRPGS